MLPRLRGHEEHPDIVEHGRQAEPHELPLFGDSVLGKHHPQDGHVEAVVYKIGRRAERIIKARDQDVGELR